MGGCKSVSNWGGLSQLQLINLYWPISGEAIVNFKGKYPPTVSPFQKWRGREEEREGGREREREREGREGERGREGREGEREGEGEEEGRKERG